MAQTSSAGATPPDVGVVLPAGGRGERAGPGAPKQFRPVAGVPLLLRALRPFTAHPRVAEIVIALPEEHAAAPPPWLGALVGERLRIVRGGSTRARSVHAGLGALSPAARLVLVHDAARPFVSAETIDAVIARAAEGLGAVAAVPVADTLKRAAGERLDVSDTVVRAGLWRAQTPQGFPRAMLETAYAALGEGGWDATDDAAVVEAAGFAVTLVPDSGRNIKVTSAEDFALAEALAAP